VLAGIALGVAVEPALFAICLIGVVDFALAWLFTSGRLGHEAQRRREAAAEGEAAADPSYNPYARED